MHVDDLSITAINSLPSLVYSTSECGKWAISNHDVAGPMIVKHIGFYSVWTNKINTHLFPGVDGSNFGRDMSVSQLVFLVPLASVTSLYVLRNM